MKTKQNNRANIHRGGYGTPFKMTPQAEFIALSAAKKLKLDIAGVDLLFANKNQTKFCVCEVNSSPGWDPFFESALNVNVPEQILSFVRIKCGLAPQQLLQPQSATVTEDDNSDMPQTQTQQIQAQIQAQMQFKFGNIINENDDSKDNNNNNDNNKIKDNNNNNEIKNANANENANDSSKPLMYTSKSFEFIQSQNKSNNNSNHTNNENQTPNKVQTPKETEI